MYGGQVLLIIDIEDTVGEDCDSSGIGEFISKLACPLETIDECRRFTHDGVVSHDI